jgi:uncharacterized protein YjbI with pentapeptide repeats
VVVAVDLTTGPILAAIAVLGAAALVAVWWIPKRQARRWAEDGIAGRELAELENGARGTVVQIIGGLALLLTFVATWMQISDTRNATNRTLRLTAAQQETERFTRAVEQLSSTRREVRIGGIYGLQGVAVEGSPYRRPAAQILLAYLHDRHRAGHRAERWASDLAAQGASFQPVCELQLQRNVADDTQAGLSVVLGFPTAARRPFKLTRTDLTFFRQPRANFTGADLTYSYLTAAYLPDARFDTSVLEAANFTRACLRRASFRDASSIREVSFDGADLRGANLSHARLSASFRFADLRGADISGTQVTRGSYQMVGVKTDGCTRLPWRREVAKGCADQDTAGSP